MRNRVKIVMVIILILNCWLKWVEVGVVGRDMCGKRVELVVKVVVVGYKKIGWMLLEKEYDVDEYVDFFEYWIE